MEIDLKAAGKRIKEIREQHKYSMARFSKLVGNSSASTVNNWEKGNNLPNQERLEKLALFGNTTVDWIRYGDFETYVKQLLSEAELKQELDKQQLKQLTEVLKKQKITYSQDLKILLAANDLFPDLFEMSYQLELSEQNVSLISEDFTTYRIEQNDRYRTDFLPMIEELLHDSNKKEINATVLYIVFDLLNRTETTQNYLSITQIFTILSEIITNDVTYRKKPTSKVIDYTKLLKKHNKGKPLAKKNALNKYDQTKEELIRLLDEFYSEYNA
ncbi:hypothetical protein ATZ33_06120 [Enterococcus silesiacus]|uniref:HTH cro/C1-type domain-containing protein n=1 Tax=Enterococcus silesiacus TaxID=332949 RepID=A0A0S3K9I4_9ENTE|nr:helix-turn-helix transcriptional regulator [Enterococcus silesiacus]ALS00959.1 hypothetical protein ATZ33_06120 [Enterococcus silesiacus]OJG89957.1 hypothetical protein RV15_GL001523 [Enterococcus silesiacus]